MIDRSEEPIWAPSKQKIDASKIKNFSKCKKESKIWI